MMNWLQRFTADDERDVSAFMERLATMPPADTPRATDMRLLWLKGQLLKRWEAERRVHAPLDLIDRVQLASGVAAILLLLVWSFPGLLRMFALAVAGGVRL